MKEQKGIHKIGAVFFLTIFLIISLCLVIIPNIKHSGFIPSLNKKIDDLFQNPEIFRVEVTSLYFWEFRVPDKELPIIINNKVIYLIGNIMKQEGKKDGFLNRKEPEILVLSFYKNNTFYLKCECQWDKIQRIIELRYYDDYGNMKRNYYSLEDKQVFELFNMIY
ncbi:MAG TPA: hypothetical protein VLZ83_08440 [Edaphocola sp.]|nr:hypothetical protein [Edaphocola sp.]